MSVVTGEMKRSTEKKTVLFPPVQARYVRLRCGPDWFIGYEHKTDAAAGIEICEAEG